MGDLPWRVGRFEIVAEIGCGAHATVYLARDIRGSATVAVKIATVEGLQNAGGVARYLREAEMVSRLEHPRINRIHEVGEDAGRVFFVEDLCAGGDLGAWLDRHPGPFDPRTAAAIVRELATAVALAHDAHVVHRAIMPANVLLVPALGGILGAPDAATGDARYDLKLTGFRLATLGAGCTGDRGSGDSDDGSVLRPIPPLPPGTLAWMAPEQVDPSVGGVGPATDVHGLGLLLHRLLTGCHPTAARTDAETLRRILFEDPPAADAAVRGVPAALAAIDLRCRAKDPRQRYAHAADLVDDLTRFLAGRPPQARPPSRAERAWRGLRRRPILAPLLVVLPVLALAGVLLTRQQRIVSRQRAAIRSLDGANEMRRGFEAWHAGRVPDAIERSHAAGAKSQRLAGGFAARWLRQRIHGEEAMLVPPAARPDPEARLDLYCLVVSPAGDRIAAGRADGTLLVFDCDTTGNPIGPPRSMRAHDEINDVGFSPDGRLLVTTGQDGRVCTWRSDSLAPVAEITAGEPPLYAAAFSSDGRLVAWGGDARVLSVAPIDDLGMPVGPIRPWTALRDHPAADGGAEPAIDSLVFTDADSVVAVAGGLMLSIDARDGAVEREFVGPKRGLGLVVRSPDGETLLTGGRDGVARLWSVASGGLLRTFPQLPGSVQGADVAPDGTWIAAGCRDGVIRVFDVATGAERNRLIGHAGRTWDVRCDRAGRILSTGDDGSLRRWQPTARIGASGLRTIELPAAVWHVVPDAAAGRVLAISAGGSNAWIDLRTGRHGTAAPLAIDGQGRCARSPWGTTLVGSGVGGGLVIVPGSNAGPRHLFDGASLGGIAWTGRGTLVTSVAEGDAWRMVTVTGVNEAPPGTVFVNGVLFDDVVEGLSVAPAGPPRLAIATGPVVRLLPLDGVGRPIAGSSRPVFDGGNGRIVRLAWSPDGERLACGDELGRVRVVDPRNGAAQTTMAQFATACGSLAWSADGGALVMGDRETVRLGDGRTGVLFDEIRPGWQIHSVFLAHDGKRGGKTDTALVIGGAATDGTGRVAVLDLRE